MISKLGARSFKKNSPKEVTKEECEKIWQQAWRDITDDIISQKKGS
jgi:hypothetical protein